MVLKTNFGLDFGWLRRTGSTVPTLKKKICSFISQVWTEEASGGGATNFITGMGGYLQSVLFGYGGLRMHSDRVDFNCTPIPDTTGFTVRGRFNIRYTVSLI